jgi:drug/metabolite transporter (DMT)-like permease
MRPATLFLTAAVVVLNVAGNFALAWGTKHAPPGAGPIATILEPWAIVGIVLLIAWTLTRMKLLGLADLSFVLPITAVGYVLNAAAGAAWLGEQISARRWTGTLLIVAGAWLTARTAQKEPTS